MKIVPATTKDEIDRVRTLFQEYWDSFGFTPCFQNFDRELEELPGKYAPPRGRLALAVAQDCPAGCVALRAIDELRCELKRLYVRPNHRGEGVGRALLAWSIDEARTCGYRLMMADTMPVMEQALAMYDRTGFVRTTPYSDDATPGAVYLELKL